VIFNKKTMPDPSAEQPRTWNEHMFFARIKQLLDSREGIIRSELPDVLNLPTFYDKAQEGYDFASMDGEDMYFFPALVRENYPNFDLVFGASGPRNYYGSCRMLEKRHETIAGTVYAERHHAVTYLILFEYILRQCIIDNQRFVYQYNLNHKSPEREVHLVIATAETPKLSMEQAAKMFVEFQEEINQALGKTNHDQQMAALSYEDRYLILSQRIFMKYLEKLKLVYYAAVESDTLHIVNNALDA
jgi:hypothetical protein